MGKRLHGMMCRSWDGARVALLAFVLASCAGSAKPSKQAAGAEISVTGPGCELSHDPPLPDLFRPLFERGRKVRYAVDDDVDPHATDGSHVTTKHVFECVVNSVRRFGATVGSEHTCASDAEQGGLSAAESISFIANDRGVWMMDGQLQDAGAVSKTLQEPPLFGANPGAAERRFEMPGMFAGVLNSCVSTIEPNAESVCVDVSCNVTQGYGDTQNRRCFSPARGFESWLHVNLKGPRITKWQAITSERGTVKTIDPSSVIAPCAN